MLSHLWRWKGSPSTATVKSEKSSPVSSSEAKSRIRPACMPRSTHSSPRGCRSVHRPTKQLEPCRRHATSTHGHGLPVSLTRLSERGALTSLCSPWT